MGFRRFGNVLRLGPLSTSGVAAGSGVVAASCVAVSEAVEDLCIGGMNAPRA